jgi:hypothetical protein
VGVRKEKLAFQTLSVNFNGVSFSQVFIQVQRSHLLFLAALNLGNKKKQLTTVIDQPSMTTIVTKEYLIPPFTEVVIHKRFFKWWTAIVLISVYVATRIFSLDLWLLWWHVANWWVIIAEATIITLTVATWRLIKHAPLPSPKVNKDKMARYSQYLDLLRQGYSVDQLKDKFPEFVIRQVPSDV